MTTTTATVTRQEQPNGRQRYVVNGEIVYQASTVLYTHFAEFTVHDGGRPIVTFHKTEAAAMKTRGATGPDGPYWTKIGHGEIAAA